MIESRDRLIREEDHLTPMSSPRLNIGVSRFSTGGERNLFGSISPSQTTFSIGFNGSPMGLMATAASRNLVMRRVGFGPNSRLGYGRGRNLYWNSSIESENVNPLGSDRRCGGRVRNSVLPSWYPRSPLQDITAVVNVCLLSLSLSFSFSLSCPFLSLFCILIFRLHLKLCTFMVITEIMASLGFF